jgi:ABC-type antimicrobial peptide transport system permease subunit
MRPASSLRLIMANLRRHKRRSVLSSMGIALGIAAMVFLVGLGQGVRREVIEGILAKLPLNEVIVTQAPGLFGDPEPLDDSALELLRAQTGVQSVYPALTAGFPCSLRGVTIGPFALPTFRTDMGVDGWDRRMIEAAAAGYRPVELGPGEIPVILSPQLLDFYNEGFAPANDLRRLTADQAVGTRLGIYLGRSSFERGAYVQRAGRVVGFSPKAVVLGVTIPLEEVRNAARLTGRIEPESYTRAYVVCSDTKAAAGLGAFAQDRGFEIETSREAVEKAGLTIDTVTVVLSIVAVIILLIAAFGIFNNFSLLVSERSVEIGVLRCVGCTRGDIRGLFTGEAGVIGLANGIVGVLLGWGATAVANALLVEYLPEFTFKPENFFHLPWWLFAGGVLLALTVAVASAWLPAGRASRIPPAEALRKLEA